MTDFLHPQSIPTPEQTEGVSDIQKIVPVSQEVEVQDLPEQQEEVDHLADQKAPALEEHVPTATPAPVRRNFATSGKQIVSKDGQEAQEGDDTKRIVRKESPLLVHYYQSIFLLLIMLFIASGYFVLNPLIAEFKKTNESIRVKLQEKDDANAFLSSVDRSIAAAKSISPETLDRINESLPKEVQIPILLKTFAQLADQNGVEMSGIQFSPQGAQSDSPTYSGYSLAPIQISLSIQAPGYLVMRKYLEDLQTNIRLMDVKSISVSGDDSTGAFSYSLELMTYYIQKQAVASPTNSIMPIGGGGAMMPPSAPAITPNDI